MTDGGRLPNFLVIGAMKSGTTSLFRYMKRHPEIYMAPAKSLHFFVAERGWPQGLEWYRAQFAGAGDAPAVGEASGTYSKYPVYKGVPERIAQVIPDVRLIYIVRNPIDRIRSQYAFDRITGREKRPLANAVLSDEYVAPSLYALQIERFLDHFDGSRLLVLTLDELAADRRHALGRVFSFLDVSPDWDAPVLDHIYHRTSEKRALRRPFRLLQRIPGYKAARTITPKPIADAYRRIAHRQIPNDLAIPPEIHEQLVDRVRSDVSRLRRYVDHNLDGWGIA